MFAPNPPPVGWGGVGGGANKKYRFSRVHEMSDIWHFYPLKLPTSGGVGCGYFFLLLFSAVHDISRTFDFLTP